MGLCARIAAAKLSWISWIRLMEEIREDHSLGVPRLHPCAGADHAAPRLHMSGNQNLGEGRGIDCFAASEQMVFEM